MTGRLMAFFTFAVLATFLGILLYRVPRLDLALILGVTLALAFYDFFLSPTRAGRKRR
jgi:uncharacterized membrane protein YfcA